MACDYDAIRTEYKDVLYHHERSRRADIALNLFDNLFSALKNDTDFQRLYSNFQNRMTPNFVELGPSEIMSRLESSIDYVRSNK
ncbi:MAG: hypothetical protein ACOYT4_04395 [Nanoarchaeota archaeon]